MENVTATLVVNEEQFRAAVELIAKVKGFGRAKASFSHENGSLIIRFGDFVGRVGADGYWPGTFTFGGREMREMIKLVPHGQGTLLIQIIDSDWRMRPSSEAPFRYSHAGKWQPNE